VDGLLPGITGWAQINGRDDLGLDAKVAQDVWYLRHRSLWLDIRILVRTLAPVISGRGNR
jgi:O-antigen biosynthesis protein WbqP